MQTQKGMGDEALMRFSQLFVVVASVVGLVTFLNPDGINDPKFTESMVMLCRIAMGIFLIELVPAFIHKIKNETIVDIISLTIIPVSTALAISLVKPDLDPHLFEIIIVMMVIVSLLCSTILKNKLAKRWSAEINSYHSDE